MLPQNFNELPLGAVIPVFCSELRFIDFAKIPPSEQPKNLTTLYAAQRPVFFTIGNSKTQSWMTEPLFKLNDENHRELHKILKGLYESEHLYLVADALKVSESECIRRPEKLVKTFDDQSEIIPEEFKKIPLLMTANSLDQFGLLNYAYQALQDAKSKLPNKFQQQLSDWPKLTPRDMYMTLSKNAARGQEPHADTELEAVFTLPVSCPDINPENAEQETTFYQTNADDEAYKAMPIGRAMIMFPRIYPLVHKAPENVKNDRYFISVAIAKPKYTKLHQENLKRFKITS
jgi:hypothetical protein